jgi:hypothetical protein
MPGTIAESRQQDECHQDAGDDGVQVMREKAAKSRTTRRDPRRQKRGIVGADASGRYENGKSALMKFRLCYQSRPNDRKGRDTAQAIIRTSSSSRVFPELAPSLP